ncbi:MAG: class I SAM-dependent methyltransferase [Lentisphaeria bacterium]|nr:class I SAM-dependent methyltransferase [Lentisphaeria bacterium]
MSTRFDAIASDYDAWYDQPVGRAILAAELDCLRRVVGTCHGRWLEVGVGTGRFAAGLGIGEGIDPAEGMLRIAARRGVRTYLGTADSLPFPDGGFDGVLLALSLCFIDEPAAALKECRRVLTETGVLLVGIVPADSPWGRLYARKKAEGHHIYAAATFRTVQETVDLAEAAGFHLLRAASTLLWAPDEPAESHPGVENGANPRAGFVALAFAVHAMTRAEP